MINNIVNSGALPDVLSIVTAAVATIYFGLRHLGKRAGRQDTPIIVYFWQQVRGGYDSLFLLRKRLEWAFRLLKLREIDLALGMLTGHVDWAYQELLHRNAETDQPSVYLKPTLNDVEGREKPPFSVEASSTSNPSDYSQNQDQVQGYPVAGESLRMGFFQLLDALAATGEDPDHSLIIGQTKAGKTVRLFSRLAYEILKGENDLHVFSLHYTPYHTRDQRIDLRKVEDRFVVHGTYKEMDEELEAAYDLMWARLILYKLNIPYFGGIRILLIDETLDLVEWCEKTGNEFLYHIGKLLTLSRKAGFVVEFASQGGLVESLGLNGDKAKSFGNTFLKGVTPHVENKFLGGPLRTKLYEDRELDRGEWKVQCRDLPIVLTCVVPHPDQTNRLLASRVRGPIKKFLSFREEYEETRDFLIEEFYTNRGNLYRSCSPQLLRLVLNSIKEVFGYEDAVVSSVDVERLEENPVTSASTVREEPAGFLEDDEAWEEETPNVRGITSSITLDQLARRMKQTGIPREYALAQLSEEETKALVFYEQGFTSEDKLGKQLGVSPATAGRIKLKLAALQLIAEPTAKR